MITPYRSSGIVLDIGTGDGRFVTLSAKASSDKFFIGIDANSKPLEKLSTKITRKSAKGGLANAMFVQAAAEDLPAEFAGIASEIYINFPWGSLLRAVATGDPHILHSLRQILIPQGRLTITIGVDLVRDQTELARHGIRRLDIDHIESALRATYGSASFNMTDCRELSMGEWSQIETSWARRLGGNDNRKVFRLMFVRK